MTAVLPSKDQADAAPTRNGAYEDARNASGERQLDMHRGLPASSTFCVLGPRAERRTFAGSRAISAAEARGLPMRTLPRAVKLDSGGCRP